MSSRSTPENQDRVSTQQSSDPDEIEAQIQADRAALAATVDALGSKFDVKAQAQDRVAHAKAKAQNTLHDPDARADALKQAAPVLAGVAVVALLIGILRREVHG